MAIKQLIKFNYNESIFLNNLRNKKYVKKNSINSKKISLKKHDLCFRNFLMNKNNKFYLIKYYKKNIGYIRVEPKKNKFMVSWALLNQFKGKGIMAKNLKKVTNNKKIKYTAIIKKNNLASIKVAKKSGFKFCSSDKNLSYVK